MLLVLKYIIYACGIIHNQTKIKEAYETVGRDRIMFGTDAPFHHPSVEIQKVLTCGLEEQGLKDVFYNNAAGLLGL